MTKQRSTGQDELTIIIASHNRADSLVRTLKSLDECKRPNHKEVTIIVVANACTDETAQECRNIRLKFDTKILSEPRIGKSFALNSGIEKASPGLIIFIDDDITVTSNFLAEFSQASEEFPDADIFAGKIIPVWPKKRPWWYPSTDERRVDGITGCFDPPLEKGYTSYLPFGGNMAIRKSVLEEHRYEEGTGKVGNEMAYGEESILCQELLDAGHKIVYLPMALAYHHLQKDFLSISYIYRRLNKLNSALVQMGFKQAEPRQDIGFIGRMTNGLIWTARVFRRAISGGGLAPVFIALEQRARQKATQHLQKES